MEGEREREIKRDTGRERERESYSEGDIQVKRSRVAE